MWGYFADIFGRKAYDPYYTVLLCWTAKMYINETYYDYQDRRLRLSFTIAGIVIHEGVTPITKYHTLLHWEQHNTVVDSS